MAAQSPGRRAQLVEPWIFTRSGNRRGKRLSHASGALRTLGSTRIRAMPHANKGRWKAAALMLQLIAGAVAGYLLINSVFQDPPHYDAWTPSVGAQRALVSGPIPHRARAPERILPRERQSERQPVQGSRHCGAPAYSGHPGRQRDAEVRLGHKVCPVGSRLPARRPPSPCRCETQALHRSSQIRQGAGGVSAAWGEHGAAPLVRICDSCGAVVGALYILLRRV
jgi:hypothetical protein